MARSKSSAVRDGKTPALRKPRSKAAKQSVADPGWRKTNIRVVGDIPWGAHICVFYETRDDLLDTAACYFEAGLSSNEFCMWAVSDPITETDAKVALGRAVPDLDRRLADGQIELISGKDWYLPGKQFDSKRVTRGWHKKLEDALAKGYEGIRISGNAFWNATSHWRAFCDYEEELDRSLAGQKMIVLCTYWLRTSSALDVLDVARAHQYSAARRNGEWELLETAGLRQARQEIKKLSDALDVLSKPFSGHKLLTPRERITLAQIVRGASSKEAARKLGISPRTVEFHRANVMHKLGAKNTADLVRRVLGE